MANEIRVQSSLGIRKGTLQYQSQPSAFTADQTGAGGPTPGAIAVSGYGTTISLAQLTTPGLCRVMNLDDDDSDDYIVVGVYDGASFFPLIELLPGESYVFRLWRHFADEFVGTATPADANVLRAMLISSTDPAGTAPLLVEAFEA